MLSTATLRAAAKMLNELSLGVNDAGRTLANDLLRAAESTREVQPFQLKMERYNRRDVRAEIRTDNGTWMAVFPLQDGDYQSPQIWNFPTGPGREPFVAQLFFHFAPADVALLDAVLHDVEAPDDGIEPGLPDYSRAEALRDLRARVNDAVNRTTTP